VAYQAVNIIGSLTTGTNVVQGQTNVDRQRMEAYRSLLKDQVTQRRADGTGNDAIEVNATTDRVTIGDAPEERRPPYAPFSGPAKATEPPAAEESPSEPTPADENRLDVVI
jgi:hypothetical protein